MAGALAACGGDGGKLFDAAPGSGSGTDGGATIDADTTPPDTLLDEHPAAATNQPSAAFVFRSDDPNARFTCALDGAAATACTSPWAPTVADGAHTVTITAIDQAGNSDPTPATWAWTVDTVPPDTTITKAPPAIDNSVATSLEFTSEPGATFECSDDGGAFAACTTPYARAGLTDGDHTFDVRAIDAVGNVDPTPAHYAWTVDTSTPDTVIDSGPTGAVQATSATFTFHSPNAGAGAVFRCALDGAAPAACTSPITYSGLAEASHTFTVIVTNAAGTSDPTPPSRTWTVDHTAPTVVIDPPTPANPTKTTTATFTFHSPSDAGATFACALDGAAFAACASGQSYPSLADGAHTFQVRATDAAGNASAPATFTWTVDTQGPTTMIVGGPASLTNQTGATFTFSANEAPVTFACAIDGGAFAPCASGKSYAALADGAHAFQVKATDAAGNTGAPASYAWTVDTQGATVTIDPPTPSDPTNATTATFAFHSPTDAGATFACALDGGAFASCTSGKTYSGLAGGAGTSHTFQVRATDSAGNTGAPASFTWTIDTQAPTVAIDPPTPASPTSATTAAFAFHSADGGVAFACAIDGGAFASCASGKTYTGLAGGAGTSHTFQVRATDTAGNTGAPASFTWTIDTQGPTVALDQTPPATTGATSATFAFHSADGGAAFECALDGGAFASCTSPKSYTPLADGPHTFQVRATDAAGNTGAPTSYAWTVDTQGATVVIDPPTPTSPTRATSATFAFHSPSDATATFTCALDAGAFASCASGKTYGGLADGAHTFQVRATDSVGNTGTPASFTWTVDTQPPTVAIDPPTPTNPTIATSATFAFHSPSDATATFACALDGAAFASCASTKAYSGLAGGAGTPHTFQVEAIDAAGNTSAPASFTWTIDTQAPTVTIQTGPASLSKQASASFTFTASESPATFACALDGAAFTTCASGQSYASLLDGPHTLQVRATDAAGNTGAPASWSWTIDTQPPTVVIDAPTPANPTTATTAAFAFHSPSDATATFACSLDGAAFASCASGKTYTGLAGGAGTSHTFRVEAIDAAGNVSAPASFTWTIDTQAPTVAIDPPTPANPTSATSATFTFHSPSDGNATFACALDGGAFTSCASGKTYSGLTGGAGTSHTFQVEAIDLAGNTGAPASFTWTIDTQGATVAIDPPTPTDPSNKTTATFAFHSPSDGNATFACALDGAAFASCTSPTTYTGLAGGAGTSHTFQVKASDALGNTGAPASFTWTIDTRAPTVTITSAPPNPTSNNVPTFAFTTGGNPTTTHCRMDGGAWATCVATYTSVALTDGSHTFEVQVIDAAGNSASATDTFTVDTQAPTVTITGGPTGTTNDNTPTFTFTTAGNPTTVQCRFDAQSFAACSASFTASPALADGAHTFEVQAIDAAGNVGKATQGFTIDTRVTISGSVSPQNAATLTATAGGATCPNGACLVAPGSTVHLAVAPNATWSFSGWTGAAVGCTGTSLAIDVTAGTVSSSCTANFQQLTVALTAQPDPVTPLTSTHLAWTRSSAVTEVDCSLDGAPFTVCTNATSQDYTNMGPGTHTFQVRGQDGRGATSATATATWVQHVDDGHVVLIGHDFHGVVPPYNYGNGVAQGLLLGAIKLARYSPVTGNWEVLIYTGTKSSSRGATEIANIEAAATAGSGAVHFTELASSDPNALTSALVGKQVLVVPDQIGGGGAALGTAWAKPLTDFVDRGGVLVVLDGVDASGNLDQTGFLLRNAGLMDYAGAVAVAPTSVLAINPQQETPILQGNLGSYTIADGSVEFGTDGRVVVIGPFIGCNNCGNVPQVVAHKTVHFLERFDYTRAWPSDGWKPATPATIVPDAASARDEVRGATGSIAGSRDQVAWAYRGDVFMPLDATITSWVRFSNNGNPQFAGLGVNAGSGGAYVTLAEVSGGQVILQPGTMGFGASPAFTAQGGASAPVAIQYGTWYRLAAVFTGPYLKTSLVDAQGNVLASSQGIVDSNSGKMGVAFGVSAGAAIDSITQLEPVEQTYLLGTTTTQSANTAFQLFCPDGEVVVGASGHAAQAIDQITTLHCGRIVRDTSKPAGYSIQPMPDAIGAAGGGPGGTPWDDHCPNDSIVTSFNSTTGYFSPYTSLYRVQLVCTSYTLTGAPGALTLTAGPSTALTDHDATQTRSDVSYNTYAQPVHGDHMVTGLLGYAGPWPIYVGFTVVNGVSLYGDRPWVAY